MEYTIVINGVAGLNLDDDGVIRGRLFGAGYKMLHVWRYNKQGVRKLVLVRDLRGRNMDAAAAMRELRDMWTRDGIPVWDVDVYAAAPLGVERRLTMGRETFDVIVAMREGDWSSACDLFALLDASVSVRDGSEHAYAIARLAVRGPIGSGGALVVDVAAYVDWHMVADVLRGDVVFSDALVDIV